MNFLNMLARIEANESFHFIRFKGVNCNCLDDRDPFELNDIK